MVADEQIGGEHPELRGQLSRRAFLKLLGVSGVGLLLSGLPGEYQPDPAKLPSLGVWERKLVGIGAVEEAGLVARIRTALTNSSSFVEDNGELLKQVKGVVPQSQAWDLNYWKDLLPPVADLMLIHEIADYAKVYLWKRGSILKQGMVLSMWLEIGRHVKEKLLPYERDPDWSVESVTRRWSGGLTPFEGTKTDTSELTLLLTNKFPVFRPMKVDEEADDEMMAILRVIMTIGSYDGTSDEIYAGVPGGKFSEKLRRFSALIICHEMGHGLDLQHAPFLMRYVTRADLTRLYQLRVAAINPGAVLSLPAEKASLSPIGWNGFDTPNQDKRLTGRVVGGDNVSDLSVDEIRRASLVYPRAYMSEGDEKVYQALLRLSAVPVPSALLGDLILGVTKMTREHVAELGGVLMYLASGIEGKVNDELIKDLVDQEPAAGYTSMMIQALGYDTVSRILESTSRRVMTKYGLPQEIAGRTQKAVLGSLKHLAAV